MKYILYGFPIWWRRWHGIVAFLRCYKGIRTAILTVHHFKLSLVSLEEIILIPVPITLGQWPNKSSSSKTKGCIFKVILRILWDLAALFFHTRLYVFVFFNSLHEIVRFSLYQLEFSHTPSVAQVC